MSCTGNLDTSVIELLLRARIRVARVGAGEARRARHILASFTREIWKLSNRAAGQAADSNAE